MNDRDNGARGRGEQPVSLAGPAEKDRKYSHENTATKSKSCLSFTAMEIMASLRCVLVLAAFMGSPAPAATIEDPDSPRFGPGLRVLGFRDEVEVVRLDEYRHLDTEPLYLARSPDREAVFREGEDLCLGKPEFGLFVACNRDLERAASSILADEPADARFGILSLSPSPASLGPRYSPGGFMSGDGGSGRTFDTPRSQIVTPPGPDVPAENIVPPESVTPVPLPASFWLMAGMIAAIGAAFRWRRGSR